MADAPDTGNGAVIRALAIQSTKIEGLTESIQALRDTVAEYCAQGNATMTRVSVLEAQLKEIDRRIEKNSKRIEAVDKARKMEARIEFIGAIAAAIASARIIQ